MTYREESFVHDIIENAPLVTNQTTDVASWYNRAAHHPGKTVREASKWIDLDDANSIMEVLATTKHGYGMQRLFDVYRSDPSTLAAKVTRKAGETLCDKFPSLAIRYQEHFSHIDNFEQRIAKAQASLQTQETNTSTATPILHRSDHPRILVSSSEMGRF